MSGNDIRKNYTTNNVTPTNDAKSHDRFLTPISNSVRGEEKCLDQNQHKIRNVEKSRASCRRQSAKRKSEYKRVKYLVNGQSSDDISRLGASCGQSLKIIR